jgi:hypothetical protein
LSDNALTEDEKKDLFRAEMKRRENENDFKNRIVIAEAKKLEDR